jgi:PAS domain S-box-containing protein
MNELGELRRRIAELEKSETGLKQAEEERIKAEERVRRTLDNVLIGCMIIGFDWTYLYVNDVAARHGHQNRENLIGRTMLEMYPGVEKSAIFAAYRRCMEKRIHQRLESEYTFTDGTTNWYELSIEPVPEGIFVLSMDITERKRAEEDLKTANKRFEEVLNSIDSLVCAIDMKTYEVLFINKFGKDIWGEIEGKICWQTIQKGQSGPCEFCTNNRLIGPDMKPLETVVWEFQNTFNKRWYECRDRAIYWPNGRLVRIGIATDITERKRAEEALKKSEILLNETQSITKSGGWEYNINTSKMTWTEETYRIYGVSPMDYDPDDVRMDIEFYAPMDRLTIESAFRRAVEEGKSYDLELKFRNARGEELWIRTIGKAERKNGKIMRVFGNIMDITERKQMEEALKESEEHYRTIIEFSNDMIWILDTEGHYQFVNKRIEEFSGLKLDYFLGKSFIPFIDKQDLPRVIDIFHKTLNGEPQQYEVSVKKGDGSNIILSVNTAPLYSKGKVVGTVSFGRDITERKKAEEQIKEFLRQKLKKSNKQRKLLCYLIEGTRGGKTRALILRLLAEKSYNAHQIAKALELDYKTIRHHLEVLVKNGIITRRSSDVVPDLYFISKNIESDLNEMDAEL